MRRTLLLLLLTLIVLPVSTEAAVSDGGRERATTGGESTPTLGEPYAPNINGHLAGFQIAGIEPDGDPLYQVVLQTKLSSSQGIPPVNLIVSAYLENFTPDTTPILPDLLHPKRTAQNLGGFLQGKALLTDDAGEVLFIGSFLAEAFLDNSNHLVTSLDGTGMASGGHRRLKGIFRLRKDGLLWGTLSGQIALPATAHRQVLQHRGAKMKPLTQIIKVVTVRPAPMRGRATTGSPGAPLRTGYPTPVPGSTFRPTSSAQSRSISPWTIVAGVGAIVAFLLAGILYWTGRRQAGARSP